VTALASSGDVREETSLFTADELVFPEFPIQSSRYADDRWSLEPLRRSNTQASGAIVFSKIPDASRRTVREVMMAVINPAHSALDGIRWKPPARVVSSIYETYLKLRDIALWADAHGTSMNDLTEQQVVRLLADWQKAGSDPSTIRHRVVTLRLVRLLASVLTDGGLAFEPWGGLTSAQVAGHVKSITNKTAAIPWNDWTSLVAGSWLIVDRYSSDILDCNAALITLRGKPENGVVRESEEVFAAWLASGGQIPLHTGFDHRGHPAVRGEVNIRLLMKLTGVHPNCFRPTHRIHRPSLVAQLSELARDSLKSTFGGLHAASAMSPEGIVWVDEIGLGEAEFLVSVLRGACYVLIAALTGMRDSEIQSLEMDCIGEADGVTSLRSIQFKGIDDPEGLRRIWWAPQPVIKVVEVLKQLSPHPTYLFGRGGKEFSKYNSHRDVKRLAWFLSVEPTSRPGGGSELGHERRLLATKADAKAEPVLQLAINQRSLRQSFAIWSARHPEAELGLGIQLGHASLRQTFGYATDRNESAVRMIDDKRGEALQKRSRDLLSGTITGPAGEQLESVIPVLEAEEFDSLVASVAERLHVGLTNDCVYDPARAKCGPDGPKLHTHNCAGDRCQNCLIGPVHVPLLRGHLKRLDRIMETTTNPALRDQLILERQRTGRSVAKFDEGEESAE